MKGCDIIMKFKHYGLLLVGRYHFYELDCNEDTYDMIVKRRLYTQDVYI